MVALNGAQFATLPAAIKAVKVDAALTKHDAQIDRSYKRDEAKRLICRNRTHHGCTWNVEVIKDTTLGTWTIVCVDSTHSESCESIRKSDETKQDDASAIGAGGTRYAANPSEALLRLDAPSRPLFQSSFGRRNLTLTQDMRWGSAKEASRAVNDFALFAQKKRARMDKKTSGGRNKKYVCSCESCGWYVRLLRAPKAESWKISSMNLQHSDCCAGNAQPTARQLADMASFRQAVVTHSKANGKLLTEEFLSSTEEGIKIPLRLAYRAKKLIAVHSQDDLVESYKFIPSLLSSFVAKNSPSIADYTSDEVGHFIRTFIMPNVSHQALPALQKILGIEVIPCTGPDYKGYVVMLLGRDGNFQPQIIALGLVPEPSTEHIHWFMTRVQRGVAVDGYPIVCTVLYPGVVEGVRRANPEAVIRFCIKSLIDMLNQDKSMTKLGSAEMLVWELHFQETEVGFVETMHQLEQVNESAANYLRKLDPSCWTSYKYQPSTQYFKWSTTTYTAGMHGSTPDGCDDAPFDILYNYLTRMMDMTFLKSQLASKLVAASTVLTPGAQEVYTDEVNESLQYTTRPSDELVAYVWKSGTRPKANFRVHLGEGTCTCSSMYQLGIPCRHFIAAARYFGQDQLILDHVGAIYKTDTYFGAFHKARIEMPLESDLSKDQTLLPAIVEGKAAQSLKPKKTRAAPVDVNPRKEKTAKTLVVPSSLPVSTDSTTEMDMTMITAMSLSMGIPGLTPQILQQYPIPPHAYLQQMQMQMQEQQPSQSNPPSSASGSGFSMV